MEIVAIALIVLAIVLMWSRSEISILAFAGFIGAGLVSDWVEPIALLSIVIYFVTALFYKHANTTFKKISSLLTLTLMSVAMASNIFPGFEKYILFEDIFVSPNKDDVSLGFTADKGVVGLLLLWLNKHKLTSSFSEFFGHLKTTAPVMLVGLFIIYGLGLLLNFIEFEFTLHWIALPMLISNLFFVVVAEEGLFRGIIQDWLSDISEKLNSYHFPLLLTSTIFGLLHLLGGWQMAVLATIAGIFYGYVYIKTQRIDIAIFMHILLNSITAIMFYST